MTKIFLFGTGITASRIKTFLDMHGLFEVEGFVVDDEFKSSEIFEDCKVWSLTEFRQRADYRSLSVFICSAWNRLNEDRRQLYYRFKEEFNLVNLVSPHAVIRGTLAGTNILIGDFSVLETGSVVHSNTFMDHQCFVGTNTVVEMHSYIAVKAMIAGNAIIGAQSFIGINSTIFDQVNIGYKSIISGGEIIKRSVEPCTVVKSSVDNQSYKKYSEKEIINKLVASQNVR